jgi:Cu(I)/Ag(I) efflux system membrane protein CusA/SilA
MQRIAVPMIGGMVSSTLLTLIVIPAVFGLVKGWRLPSDPRADIRPPPPSRRPARELKREIPETAS